MTLRARIISLFPLVAFAVDLAALAWVIARHSIASIALLPVAVYLVPLIVFRLHALAYPLRPGSSRIDTPKYSPWWGGHQIQLIFDTFPALEMTLRLVPGLYSLWLRAWGSRIGKSVYWTPTARIFDRNLMVIGDRVVFGHQVECFGHLIAMRKGRLLLYVWPVRIDSGSFIGGYARLAPGVVLEEGVFLNSFVHLGPQVTVKRDVAVPTGTAVPFNATVNESNAAKWTLVPSQKNASGADER